MHAFELLRRLVACAARKQLPTDPVVERERATERRRRGRRARRGARQRFEPRRADRPRAAELGERGRERPRTRRLHGWHPARSVARRTRCGRHFVAPCLVCLNRSIGHPGIQLRHARPECQATTQQKSYLSGSTARWLRGIEASALFATNLGKSTKRYGPPLFTNPNRPPTRMCDRWDRWRDPRRMQRPKNTATSSGTRRVRGLMVLHAPPEDHLVGYGHPGRRVRRERLPRPAPGGTRPDPLAARPLIRDDSSTHLSVVRREYPGATVRPKKQNISILSNYCRDESFR